MKVFNAIFKMSSLFLLLSITSCLEKKDEQATGLNSSAKTYNFQGSCSFTNSDILEQCMEIYADPMSLSEVQEHCGLVSTNLSMTASKSSCSISNMITGGYCIAIYQDGGLAAAYYAPNHTYESGMSDCQSKGGAWSWEIAPTSESEQKVISLNTDSSKGRSFVKQPFYIDSNQTSGTFNDGFIDF